jgi:hypothetical protein
VRALRLQAALPQRRRIRRNIELGLNRSFSLFFNQPSTNPI